ncbi:MAG: hypothetical protein NTX50_16630 [Candidatus Sumerlaeota bacterium]|nr:hypothetical protein [Candidatus Sumerlaeota bacterium]
MTEQQLREIQWNAFTPGNPMSPEEFEEMLRVAEAFWLYSGNPADPHAGMTSGRHTNGYIDVLRLLSYSNICLAAAQAMALKIRAEYHGPIDWVIGSDHAGAALAQNVAVWLGARSDFTEKGPDKSQLWKRFQIKKGEVVLQVEELMSTALTFGEVRKGIRTGNVEPVTFAPVAGVLVHRSDVWEFDGTKIVDFCHYRHLGAAFFDDETQWSSADIVL